MGESYFNTERSRECETCPTTGISIRKVKIDESKEMPATTKLEIQCLGDVVKALPEIEAKR